MIKQIAEYLCHRFKGKLVMTILVKNEADIIEQNIRVHRALGVDAFVVMDNDSSDGTRSILEKLKKEMEIVIIDEKGAYNQAKWMTKLAKVAKYQLKADWVINNDADEFWIPKNGKSLKEVLNFKGSILACNRYNMLLYKGVEEGEFLNSIYRVDSPVVYGRKNEMESEKLSMTLTKIGPKVIVNPKGLFHIRGGNHSAIHIGKFKGHLIRNYKKMEMYDEISVFHFPMRSYEQFEKNIENRKSLLEGKKHIKMGPHYRRWVKIYNEGKLKNEFNENIVFQSGDVEVLEKYGIVKKDSYVTNRIKELLKK